MYRVVDKKTYETIFVGFTEEECITWVIDNGISGVFIEKVERKEKNNGRTDFFNNYPRN